MSQALELERRASEVQRDEILDREHHNMVEAEERQKMVDAIDMALAPRKENQGNQYNQGDHLDCEDRKGE